MHRNIFAYTPCEPRPPFISVNRKKDGNVVISVRSRPEGAEVYGLQAHIELPEAEFRKLATSLFNETGL